MKSNRSASNTSAGSINAAFDHDVDWRENSQPLLAKSICDPCLPEKISTRQGPRTSDYLTHGGSRKVDSGVDS